MALSRQKLLQLRDDLEIAIFSGARSITHDGKTVEYGSLSEMNKALTKLNLRINGASHSIQYLALSSGDRNTGPGSNDHRF